MISVSSITFSTQSIESSLESISKEFGRWEVFAEAEHAFPRALRAFGALAPSYDLKFSIHAPISDVNLGSMTERMREASTLEMMSTMENAIKMEVDLITIHPGYNLNVLPGTDDRVMMNAKKSLRTLDRVSQEFGVRIAVENMPNFFMMIGRRASELEELIDGTDLGVCFDIGHANTSGQLEEMLSLKDRIINVHIHDNLGENDDHMTIGDGAIDFRKVLSGLNGYSRNYVIEAKSLESAIISRDRLKGFLG